MSYKLLLGTFSILALATCKNQTTTEKNITPSGGSTNSAPATPTLPQIGEPEMSVGLPPDPAAIELSKKEEATTAKNTAVVIYLKEGETKFFKQY